MASSYYVVKHEQRRTDGWRHLKLQTHGAEGVRVEFGDSMAIPAGTRIGSYEVVGSLGAGGMGEVFRALDHRLDRDIALKILPNRLRPTPDRVAPVPAGTRQRGR